jgi:hypothetical protein
MKCVIPLAGPDFILADGTLKPLFAINGVPLIQKVLNNRAWVLNKEVSNEDFIFILRETPRTDGFKKTLNNFYPGCKIITLPCLTQGALFSALSAVSIFDDWEAPLCLDLIDIHYHSTFSPQAFFKNNPHIHGVIPYFESENPKFSYLELNGSHVLSTIEKKVISTHASAGTYFFKNTHSFLKATLGSLEHKETLTYKNSFFVCPSYNILIKNKLDVTAFAVSDVESYSHLFH